MESIEIDIKMRLRWGRRRKRKGAERWWKKKKKKQAQGDARSSSHGECPSKQCFSLGWVPAEQQRSASAHYVKYSEQGMKLMMMMRKMRIKMMMAVLCCPLTLPPWSELFYLQSCLLKYIQLSSVDQWVLPRHSASPLSHKIRASHCPALQQSRKHVHIVFSFVNTESSQGQLQIQVMYHKTSIAHVPPMAQVMILGPSFWASSCSTAHTMLLTQVIWITRINGGKSL